MHIFTALRCHVSDLVMALGVRLIDLAQWLCPLVLPPGMAERQRRGLIDQARRMNGRCK